MKQNQVFVLIISLILLLSFIGVVGAAEIDEKSTSKYTTTDVIFSHESETYTVVIPDRITLAGLNENVSSAVNATSVVLDSTDCLNITVVSKNGWKAISTTNPTHNITYGFEYKKNNEGDYALVAGGDAIEILHLSAGTSSVETPLIFTRTSTPPSTGTYTDVLTFSVNVNIEVHN